MLYMPLQVTKHCVMRPEMFSVWRARHRVIFHIEFCCSPVAAEAAAVSQLSK